MSRANVRVTPDEAESIITWGQVRGPDGRTLLAWVRFEERWSVEELHETAWVELAPAAFVESPQVLNRRASYAFSWACTFCDRLDAEQVDDLELVLEGEPALHFRGQPELRLTSWGELVVSSRLGPLFEEHRLGLRSIAGTRSWLQVELGPVCSILPVHPCEIRSDPCPGCGHSAVARSDVPRRRSPFQEPHIHRIVPWVAQCLSGAAMAGWSRERIGVAGTVAASAVHVAGARVDVGHRTELLGMQGAPVLFARPALVAALARADAFGLDARPVSAPAASGRHLDLRASSGLSR